MFQKAERKQSKLKLAITGPSGSGKTFSALSIAKGLGSRIAVIDTENKSASLYADRFDFEVCELSPPYTSEKYIAAMKAAEAAKYDVIIIDSLTHQWQGEGGLLNRKEQLDSRGGNSFANWAKMTPEYEKFKSAILQLQCHTICTIRSKQEYQIVENEKGKSAPKKMGMAPIQRDGLEYEFTVVLDMSMNHNAVASKDRTGLFDEQIFKPSEETGKILLGWLLSAKEVPAAPMPQPVAQNATPSQPAPTSTALSFSPEWKVQANKLRALMTELKITDTDMKILISGEFRTEDVRKLTVDEITKVIRFYEETKNAPKVEVSGKDSEHIMPKPQILDPSCEWKDEQNEYVTPRPETLAPWEQEMFLPSGDRK